MESREILPLLAKRGIYIDLRMGYKCLLGSKGSHPNSQYQLLWDKTLSMALI